MKTSQPSSLQLLHVMRQKQTKHQSSDICCCCGWRHGNATKCLFELKNILSKTFWSKRRRLLTAGLYLVLICVDSSVLGQKVHLKHFLQMWFGTIWTNESLVLSFWPPATLPLVFIAFMPSFLTEAERKF